MKCDHLTTTSLVLIECKFSNLLVSWDTKDAQRILWHCTENLRIITSGKSYLHYSHYNFFFGFWLWVRSPLEEVKQLFTFIFSFLRYSVEAKRGTEFHHSTHNASRTWRKVGNGVSYQVSSAYLAVCGIQREVKKNENGGIACWVVKFNAAIL